MKTKQSPSFYLLNFVFLLGLTFLVLNDHVFKAMFSNGLTGKLSDFCGLLILPMFLSFFLPGRWRQMLFLSGLFFVFWKSPFSQPFIDVYNQVAVIRITRVVDYSDLWALTVLPISYLLLLRMEDWTFLHFSFRGLRPVMIWLPATFAFMATSPAPRYYYLIHGGELNCFRCTKVVKKSKPEILDLLAESNYSVRMDTIPYEGAYRFDTFWRDSLGQLKPHYPYYIIDTLVLGQDTLMNLQFSLKILNDSKTKVQVNGLDISEEIPDEKAQKLLMRSYRTLIKTELKRILE